MVTHLQNLSLDTVPQKNGTICIDTHLHENVKKMKPSFTLEAFMIVPLKIGPIISAV